MAGEPDHSGGKGVEPSVAAPGDWMVRSPVLMETTMVVMRSFAIDQFEVDGNVASVWLTGG